MRGAELAVEEAAAEGRGAVDLAVEGADLVAVRAADREADLEAVASEAESVADSAEVVVALAVEIAGDSVAPGEGLAVVAEDSAIVVVPVAAGLADQVQAGLANQVPAGSADQVRVDSADQVPADSIAVGNSTEAARPDSGRRAAASWTVSWGCHRTRECPIAVRRQVARVQLQGLQSPIATNLSIRAHKAPPLGPQLLIAINLNTPAHKAPPLGQQPPIATNLNTPARRAQRPDMPRVEQVTAADSGRCPLPNDTPRRRLFAAALATTALTVRAGMAIIPVHGRLPAGVPAQPGLLLPGPQWGPGAACRPRPCTTTTAAMSLTRTTASM